MKYLIFTAFLAMSSLAHAQHLKPYSLNASYLGETITHPGFKLGTTHHLKTWNKYKNLKNGDKILIHKNIELSPSVGFFSHKDYQTCLFILPELGYSRKNSRGNYKSAGFGAGYMRTIIPKVYELKPNGNIEKIDAGHNYFLTNIFITFGKDVSVFDVSIIDIYIKPQLMYAVPNVANGVYYFALELGLKHKLSRK